MEDDKEYIWNKSTSKGNYLVKCCLNKLIYIKALSKQLFLEPCFS